MKSKFYIYKSFFQEKDYIKLNIKRKYMLILLYSLSDDDYYFRQKKIELAKILNISKQTTTNTIKLLENKGYLSRIDPHNIKLPKPTDTDKIPMSETLVTGKYKHLSHGAKIFYTYYQNLQEQENKEYLKITGEEIVKPIGITVRTLQEYYKELETVGLLKKGKETYTNTFSFKKIEDVTPPPY
ncbi:TPA: MarR family transcriptional regulator [Staphylococcus aureus]|nr:MarR family transcriptional regulator [Staphylococcus aureus]